MAFQRRLLMHSIVLSAFRSFSCSFSTGKARILSSRRSTSSALSASASSALSAISTSTSLGRHHITLLKRKQRKACSALNARFSNSEHAIQANFCLQDDQETWLIVGDGDLSFSARQAQKLDKEQVQLIGSVLEDKKTHEQVYRNSNQNAETIAYNHSVIFGVDATQLEHRFPSDSFDRIIFNFPHWRGKSNNRYNRCLLHEFLQSAVRVLKPTGEIHVALCEGQGGTEATSVEEWRRSWLAAQYAAEHGLLLRRLETFEPSYDLSSHRGFDRPFRVGKRPLQYIFGYPEGTGVDQNLQVACRHELRLIMDPVDIEASPCTKEELVEGDIIPKLVQTVLPDGIRSEVPLRDVIVTQKAPVPFLVFLIVYTGESQPLTRSLADQIRSSLEKAATEQLGLAIAKRDRMVSKPFPYPILETLIEDRS